MTLSELAYRMNLGTASVARTIDSLEARGLLTRTQSDLDRRMVLLSLTKEGKTLQNAASADFHNYMAELFTRMDSKQRDGLVRGLEALLQLNDGSMDAGDDHREKRNFPRSQKQ